MEKVELRKKDFVTSLILIAFGIFMILYTLLEIPMKDSWGGVMNVWFVSPGLFPVCIGGLIILMGTILCHRAIKDGGARRFFEDLSIRKRDSSGKNLRFLGILAVILAYVYLYIPRIDYFLSTMLSLLVFISFFYLDRPGFLKRLFVFYVSGCLFFLIVFLARVDVSLNEGFAYFMDLLVFLFFLSYTIYCWILSRGDSDLRSKLRLTLIMSVIPSLVLIPSFKYLLLVPLPVEGGFIELMNVLRYALR